MSSRSGSSFFVMICMFWSAVPSISFKFIVTKSPLPLSSPPKDLVAEYSIINAEYGSSGPLSDSFSWYLSSVKLAQTHMDAVYNQCSLIKCPFLRRRTTDIIDNSARIWQFILARHKSIPVPVMPGCNPIPTKGEQVKREGLSVRDIANIIESDWNGRGGSKGKGYYITGKLSKEIYRDDCFFDGPDPDMPVRGLRKYISSTAQLFDKKKSRADIISFEVDEVSRVLKVCWRLEGILNLPWHPTMKPWTGSTTYHIDEHGLIDKHVETWDIEVLDAFISTLFPSLNFGAPPAPPFN